MPETENTETAQATEPVKETTNDTTESAAKDEISGGADNSALKTDAEKASSAVEPQTEEEISYHAVEKEGNVTAIWEMQGRRHLRTIDPRSQEGKHILSLFTSEHHEEAA